VAERSHLSIGEVLSLLREEFPDVTISKIRFLESQGLVDPERTPSGYRKFYEHDVERLRWILRQQRENFLPLKVIRGRLSEDAPSEPLQPVAAVPMPDQTDERAKPRPLPSLFADNPSRSPRPVAVERGAHRPQTDHPSGAAPAGGPRVTSWAETGPADTGRAPADPRRPSPSPVAGGPSLDLPDDADSYTAPELAGAAGAAPGLVRELEQFGLISARAVVAGVPYFDDYALAVTRTAAELARHGIEVRHLRVWKNAADREADLYQQIVLPLLRQRNPQARRQASETLTDLARLGGDLRVALIGRAVRDIR
jgi:DNA-binding transcriptional MerR regulator